MAVFAAITGLHRAEQLELSFVMAPALQGEVLDVLVQQRRNKAAALKLLRKLLKNQGSVPDEIVTDGLASYKAAMRDLGCNALHKPGRLRDNNRVENSHLPIRRHGGVARRVRRWSMKFRLRASARSVSVTLTKAIRAANSLSQSPQVVIRDRNPRLQFSPLRPPYCAQKD